VRHDVDNRPRNAEVGAARGIPDSTHPPSGYCYSTPTLTVPETAEVVTEVPATTARIDTVPRVLRRTLVDATRFETVSVSMDFHLPGDDGCPPRLGIDGGR
jgi:hypothetical protein